MIPVARPAEAPPSIPVARPVLGEREEELVLEVLRSGQLSLGPMLPRFERAFADRLGVEHASAVSSGTAGLHLALRPLGLEPGDEVITSPFSFVASANVALYEGARPVFADIDPVTLNLDPEAARAAVTERTKALLPVHIFGAPADVPAFETFGLPIVEDACEALGAVHEDGTVVGTRGHPAVFAFYANKQMTTGEGGMVTTHSEEEWSLLKSLRNQGRADGGGWLEHARLGYNYRIDDIRAALGIGQLEKLDTILELRAAAAARYGELLGDVEGLEVPLADDAEHVRSWFVYVVTLARGTDRERVIAELERQGIAT
ncbi:MAG: DegT/DnrJ/EryC1/StrS family aminotransferase, partial [Actinomycetota bacterium]|nr:DegT/DnrJ/EryC1/StrS family aminotransferase [Actinomycetota bacterium]